MVSGRSRRVHEVCAHQRARLLALYYGGIATIGSIACGLLLLTDSSTRHLIGPGHPDLLPGCYTGLELALGISLPVADFSLAEAWSGSALLFLSPLAAWLVYRRIR